MKREFKQWLGDSKREYKKGLELFHANKLSTKHDTFLNTNAPTQLHKNILFRLMLQLNVTVSNRPDVDIEKPEQGEVIIQGEELPISPKDLANKDIIKMPEASLEYLRSMKQYVNKVLSLNFSDLGYKDKAMFFNNESYFLKKKTLLIENSEHHNSLVATHAKLRAVDEGSENDAERKSLLEYIQMYDEYKTENWGIIDTWIDPIEKTENNSMQDAVKLAFDNQKRIKANHVFLNRAEKSYPLMKELTAKQKQKKQKKNVEIQKRKQELIDLGSPYKG